LQSILLFKDSSRAISLPTVECVGESAPCSKGVFLEFDNDRGGMPDVRVIELAWFRSKKPWKGTISGQNLLLAVERLSSADPRMFPVSNAAWCANLMRSRCLRNRPRHAAELLRNWRWRSLSRWRGVACNARMRGKR